MNITIDLQIVSLNYKKIEVEKNEVRCGWAL